jgi:D-lactate dehydrogenase (cytochrome)
LEFSTLSATHIAHLKSLVAEDRFSTGESVLHLHARDQSHHAPVRPEAVIWPTSAREVSQILAYADDQRIPITGWGSGSSLEGNPIPMRRGIVLDFTQMNRILKIHEEDFQVDLEPGVVYQDLNEALKYTGLFFPPDPGARATLGGMIANNAAGTRTIYYGSTKDYVLRLSVALANGEILQLGTRASKTSSGYDLIRLFVGSEGTLGIVVGATLRLAALPADYSAAVASFPSVAAASRTVSEIMRAGLNPAALELLGPECVALMNREEGLGLEVLPTVFMEFHGATAGQLSEVMEMAQEVCEGNGCRHFEAGIGRARRDRIFKARHALGEMIWRNHPDCRILVVDVAVPITAFPELSVAIQEEMGATGLTSYFFSHAGNGNVHLNIAGRKESAEDWALIDRVVHRLVTRSLALGGTATGEHGVGLGKQKFMAAEHGAALEWMRRVKALFDPHGILNPDKVLG